MALQTHLFGLSIRLNVAMVREGFQVCRGLPLVRSRPSGTSQDAGDRHCRPSAAALRPNVDLRRFPRRQNAFRTCRIVTQPIDALA
jgi:hypothetical protein